MLIVINSYFDVMDKLNVERANIYPKATEHIKEIIGWISKLVDTKAAYVVDKDVYYNVQSFADYGKLSGRSLDDMKAGARVNIDKRKKSPFDFTLWKESKPGEPGWASPWGYGRPGWHIECSVMSTKYLGDQFDIHGGGLDLTFPHHENEIAQTEPVTGKHPWVKYWMHNGFVNVNHQKMSKSLGNFFTLKDIFQKFDPMAVRLFILMTHYRSPINFSDDQLEEGAVAYGRILRTMEDIKFLESKVRTPAARIEVLETEDELAVFRAKFEKAMNDDFNTAGGVGVVFEFVRFINEHTKSEKADSVSLAKYKKFLIELCDVLGLTLAIKEVKGDSTEASLIEGLISERKSARQNKDFAKADEIRKKLDGMGVVLEDTAYGTKWRKS